MSSTDAQLSVVGPRFFGVANQLKLDEQHPCSACGAPWSVIMAPIFVAELDEPAGWVPVQGSGGCSARCYETGRTSPERYEQVLAHRRELG